MWVKPQGQPFQFKVLEEQLPKRLDGPLYLTPEIFQKGSDVDLQSVPGDGFPRIRESHFRARFPFAEVPLSGRNLPVSAVVEGWSPFYSRQRSQ